MKTEIPFVYFGAKRWMADFVLPVISGCHSYVDPFFGSGSMLLSLPKDQFKIEIVGDANGLLVNLFRSIRKDVDSVIANLESTVVSEVDLIAATRTCGRALNDKEFISNLKDSLDYYNPKYAAAYYMFMKMSYPNAMSQIKKISNPLKPHLNESVSLSVSLKHHSTPYTSAASNGKRVYLEGLTSLAERISLTAIFMGGWDNTLEQGYKKIMKTTVKDYEGHKCFLFADPPYGGRSEGGESADELLYGQSDFDNDQFESIMLDYTDNSDFLVVVCGHRDRPLLSDAGWHKVTMNRPRSFRKKSGTVDIDSDRAKREEFIYCNQAFFDTAEKIKQNQLFC